MQTPVDPEHTSISYWQRTVEALPLESQLPAEADIVIIGGGIVGVALSYWLARAGRAPVLLERAHLAYGATGRNGGIVAIGLAEGYPSAIKRHGAQVAQAILRLTLENQALLRQVIADEQFDCQYRETGHIGLALSEQELEHLAHAAATKEADGYEVQVLTRQEVQERIHTRLGERILGGTLWAQGGLVHSARLVHELARVAQRHGARFLQAEVGQLASEGEDVVVRAAQGSIRTRQVVVATNAWVGDLLPAFRPLITPVRGQMLAYEPFPQRIFESGIFAAFTPSEEYGQQTLDGSIVIGGCRAIAPGRDVNIREQTTSSEVQGALEQVIPTLFPDLAHLRVAQRWGGTMAFTPDYIPIIDQEPALPSVWGIGGFTGHGMPFAMRVGQLLAESLDQPRRAAALEPFRLKRSTLLS
ncbi:FAD-dependent oxidoreductase [Ktedonobacter sp. SOSP1-85]|uniref:NAD(P)/FAD-dependent oxidoreductase n=1 Tax=Ktedonobacter sp. SOSP1-85 TaxID=2778367 RepID=UPI0019156480|nr:FAD-dependent oxidoreductase [Ktedonobacter sp. SOSP1-85]GHO72537.1 FAD-dependent oxidoreductase [Ktedonobacter sp. SOSP1-85]